MSGVSPTVSVPYYYWTSPQGASSSTLCACQKGYTGTNCEFSVCPDTLPGGSFGSVFFQADTKLRQFTTSASETVTIEAYLNNLIRVGVDVNGDGVITTAELLTALGNRLIYSDGMTQLPLWCITAKVWSYCYEGVVEVQNLFDQAMANYIATGYFDGSGTKIDLGCAGVTSMIATYPVPSWSVNTCRTSDHSINPSATISVEWILRASPPVKRVCGYVNGYLDNEFSTTPILTGTQTF